MEQGYGIRRRSPKSPAGLVAGGAPTCQSAGMGCLTDVPGVRVSHLTLGTGVTPGEAPVVRTGVTAVLPHDGDLRARPVTAAAHVLNGYGKPLGLAQVAELGELEAPVLLTGTFGVGAAHEGALRWLLARDPDLGRPATANPVVLECNDGRLHDLRTLALRPEDVTRALDAAAGDTGGAVVAEGAVGAGHGMVAFGWKGGVGTASRPVADGGAASALGALVLTNMGRPEDLRVDARIPTEPAGAARPLELPDPADGSVVVLLATDAPLDARQLGRLARRAQNGLARTGVSTAHGSGEFVLAFSTTQPRHRRDGRWLDPWFDAVADVVEEAVLSSLRSAVTTTGRDGRTAHRCPLLGTPGGD